MLTEPHLRLQNDIYNWLHIYSVTLVKQIGALNYLLQCVVPIFQRTLGTNPFWVCITCDHHNWLKKRKRWFVRIWCPFRQKGMHPTNSMPFYALPTTVMPFATSILRSQDGRPVKPSNFLPKQMWRLKEGNIVSGARCCLLSFSPWIVLRSCDTCCFQFNALSAGIHAKGIICSAILYIKILNYSFQY